MPTLFFTVKEWNRFNWDKQQVLTKKYNVILTDYKTKKERALNLLDKINFKNFNKGISIFNNAIQQFGNSMDKITNELSTDVKKSNKSTRISEEKNKQNLEKIWGKPRKTQNHQKIWSDPQTKEDIHESGRHTDEGIW